VTILGPAQQEHSAIVPIFILVCRYPQHQVSCADAKQCDLFLSGQLMIAINDSTEFIPPSDLHDLPDHSMCLSICTGVFFFLFFTAPSFASVSALSFTGMSMCAGTHCKIKQYTNYISC